MSDTQALVESIKEDVRVISDAVDVVTHLARKHSRQISDMNRHLIRVDVRLDEHDRHFDRIEAKLNEHDQRFDRIDRELVAVKGQLGELDTIKGQLGELDTIKGQLGELTVMRGQLAEILDRLAS